MPARLRYQILLAALLPAGFACADTRGCRSSCGTAVIVSATDADVLLPPVTQGNIGMAISELLFLKLADVGLALNTVGDSGFVPRLARSWRFEDSLTLAFHLDPRARWQDGQPVTAADVVFTFEVNTDTLVNARPRSLLGAIASVTARDSATAVFHFRRWDPEQFFTATHHTPILPRHLLDTIPRGALAAHAFGRSPIGSGPYRFVRWEAGQSIELAADTTFFQGAPGLKRLIWRITPDFPAAVTQLVAGEADIMETLGGPENVARVSAAPDYRVVTYPSGVYAFLGFNLQDGNSARPHPLFTDRELRRALAMAVDRVGLTRALLGEYGRVPAGPASRMLAIGRDSMTQIPFDSAGARRALAALGWRDTDGDGVLDRGGRSLGFELLVPISSQVRRRAAVILQDQLKRVGVAVRIAEVDFNLFLQRTGSHRFETALLAWSQDPSPASIVQTFTTASITQGQNYGSYRSPRFDQLVDAAVHTADPRLARERWREAFREINDDAPAIWLYTPETAAGVHRRFENVSFRPDQWTATLSSWKVAPGRLIDRDRVGLR